MKERPFDNKFFPVNKYQDKSLCNYFKYDFVEPRKKLGFIEDLLGWCKNGVIF